MKCPNFLADLIFSRPIGMIVNALRALINKKPDPRFIVGANPQDTIHKVLIAMGFESASLENFEESDSDEELIAMGFEDASFEDLEDSDPYSDGEVIRVYCMENSSAFNMVQVYSDHVFLKMYSNHTAFSDSEVIGPPLPNARELVEFINYEGMFEGDD